MTDATTAEEKVPITLLSGFLGSGKTSTLKNLLENTEGIKVGVIVNDVASVNIDAKLIRSKSSNMIQLENGCACCSLADELLTSVDQILSASSSPPPSSSSSQMPSLSSSSLQNRKLDALVVELSGVADPVSVKNSWKVAEMAQHPATTKSTMAKVVTLVDACTFGTDWMTMDEAGQRRGWVMTSDMNQGGDDCIAGRRVTELLAEQVEAADLILVNKIDLAGPHQVQIASAVAQGINEKATIQQVQFGEVSPTQILGDVLLPPQQQKEEEEKKTSCCSNPSCPSNQKQKEEEEEASNQEEETVSATTSTCGSSKTKSAESTAQQGCTNSKCADTSCTDSDCGKDTAAETNSEDDDEVVTIDIHSHSHDFSTESLGITSFVYKRDRPFHPKRLLNVLNEWPVPIKDDLDLTIMQEASSDYEMLVDGQHVPKNPFAGVLRSKGFCWVAPQKWYGANNDAFRHDTAMHWSHAGKHFGIAVAGKWWATIPQEAIRKFMNEQEFNRMVKDDFVSLEWGDRRQEIVFIGANISEEEITKALDACLLTNSQMKVYRKRWEDHNSRQMVDMEVLGGGLFQGDAM